MTPVRQLTLRVPDELGEGLNFRADFYGGHDSGPRFAVTDLTSLLLEDAADLVASKGLRAPDAAQLASALGAREASPDLGDFACFDTPLRRDAARAGFSFIPTELGG